MNRSHPFLPPLAAGLGLLLAACAATLPAKGPVPPATYDLHLGRDARGWERSALVHVPPGLGASPRPLLVVLHGASTPGRDGAGDGLQSPRRQGALHRRLPSGNRLGWLSTGTPASAAAAPRPKTGTTSAPCCACLPPSRGGCRSIRRGSTWSACPRRHARLPTRRRAPGTSPPSRRGRGDRQQRGGGPLSPAFPRPAGAGPHSPRPRRPPCPLRRRRQPGPRGGAQLPLGGRRGRLLAPRRRLRRGTEPERRRRGRCSSRRSPGKAAEPAAR